MLLNLLLDYVKAHPDQVVDLAKEGVEAAINALKKHNQQARA